MKPSMKLKDKQCWVCGTTKNLTKAHVIPQYLKPHHNKIVPVCIPHHREIDIRFQFQWQMKQAIGTIEEILIKYKEIKDYDAEAHGVSRVRRVLQSVKNFFWLE